MLAQVLEVFIRKNPARHETGTIVRKLVLSFLL